jgi:predicted patatin/cPLA2 family phospholipase
MRNGTDNTAGSGRQQVIDLLQRRRAARAAGEREVGARAAGEREVGARAAGGRDGDDDPGDRPGSERLVLCIEGGGLRGVVAAGMLLALDDLGFTADDFDAVYGSSAGGIAGAYFIGGSPAEAMPLYYREVPRYFLDWTRMLRGRPALDLDRIIDRTIVADHPLDIDAVVASGKLRLIASDIGEVARLGHGETQPVEARCFPPPTSAHELLAFLRATTRIPLLGGPPVPVPDPPHWPDRRDTVHAYLDAFLTEGLPLDSPIADGATHLVVLTTKPYAATVTPNRLVKALAWWRLRRVNPALVDLVADRGHDGDRRAALITRGQTDPAPGEPAIWCVSPTRPVGVGSMRADGERILAGAQTGYRLLRSDLGLDEPVSFESEPTFRAVLS